MALAAHHPGQVRQRHQRARSATRCARSGLRGIGKSVERPDSPQLRGMVHRVRHLITVEEK